VRVFALVARLSLSAALSVTAFKHRVSRSTL